MDTTMLWLAALGIILILVGLFVPIAPFSPLISTNIFLLALGFLLLVPGFMSIKGVKHSNMR